MAYNIQDFFAARNAMRQNSGMTLAEIRALNQANANEAWITIPEFSASDYNQSQDIYDMRRSLGNPQMSDAELIDYYTRNPIPVQEGWDWGDLAKGLAIPGAFIGAGLLSGAFPAAGATAGTAGTTAGAATGSSMAGAEALGAMGTEAGFGFGGAATGAATGAGTVAGGAALGAGAGGAGGGLLSGLGLNPMLLGAGAGALLSGLGGGSKPAGETTSTTAPWGPQQPYILNAMSGATDQLNRMGTSTPLLQPAQSEIGKTISGAYLRPESNPYLDDTFKQASRAVTDAYLNVTQPRTDAMFFGPGSMGGNSAYSGQVARNQYGLGENLSNLATNIYGGNYSQERNRQFLAATGAPEFTSAYYRGGMAPYSAYSDVVGRGYGGTTSQPYFTNPTAGLLGGALTGAALGKMIL